MVHELKTSQEFFKDVWYGYKTAEIRKNDRDFQINDKLILREFINGAYTDRRIEATIGYMLDAEQFPDGLQEHYCMLCLIDITNQTYN